ncbi:hypothetical protein BH23ACT9_BH23ACT9_25710 [soil metagenome]
MSDQQSPPPLPPTGPPPSQPPPPKDPVLQDEEVRTHALQHASQATRTYPCTACGGELLFDIGQQRLRCPHCGNQQDLAEASGAVQENDLTAAIAGLRSSAAAQTDTLVSGEKEIVCQNCGGHTTFTGTWTAQRCPFCATPIQRDDVHVAPQRLKVDGVLPFLVDERAAKEALTKWVGSRWFAPNEFKDYSRAGSFSSIYTAYFTYDAQARTSYRGQRGDDYTVTVGSGDNKRTETRTRWRNVSGQVHNAFDDVTILANEGLDKNHTTALQPWPMQQIKPFSPEYIAGHLSRTYDRQVDECFTDAQSVMEGEIERTIRQDIGGDHQKVSSKQITWGGLTFKHLLLPIWLLTVMYDSRPFQVMINGATGKVEGERPYSKVKIIAAVLVAIALIVLAVVLFGGGDG